MKFEKEQILRTEFSFYTGFYGRGLPFECGDGWFDLLYELSKGIQELIDDGIENPEFAVHQVKEKFGTLRYYTGSMVDETEALIDEAEEKSAVTCEWCGNPGNMTIIGNWYTTLCKECHIKNLSRFGMKLKPETD